MKKTFTPLSYFREVSEEVKKVAWPSREQTIQLTGIVVGVSIAVGLYISVLDIIFTQLIEFLLG